MWLLPRNVVDKGRSLPKKKTRLTPTSSVCFCDDDDDADDDDGDDYLF